jgi:hypothetical protein
MSVTALVNIPLKMEQIIYSFQESLKSYRKLRLRGQGTRDIQYTILVPKIYIGEKYCPDKRYSVSFGTNKENNHQLIVIDLDDVELLTSAYIP